MSANNTSGQPTGHPRAEPQMTSTGRRLQWGTVALLIGWGIHSADHFRRGLDDSPRLVIGAGFLSAAIIVIGAVLVLTRSRYAPAFCAIGLGAVAIGTTVTHFGPNWGPATDSLIFDSATDGWSIVSALAELIPLAWVAWLGFTIMRANHYEFSIPASDWHN